MERITRHKFVARLYEKLGSKFYSCRLSKNFTYTDSYWVTKAVFECMTDILKEGNILFVTECFTIQRKFKAERVVGNFGKSKVVPAHYSVVLNPLKGWKKICKDMGNMQDSESAEVNKHGEDVAEHDNVAE